MKPARVLAPALAAIADLSACSITVNDGTRPAVAREEWRCTTVDWIEPGRPIVHATLDGRELRFLVDSGAEYDGWMSKELAAELGLPVVGTVPTEGEDDPTGGLPFYGVKTLRLGDLTFRDLRFAETPDIGPGAKPFDAIIGNGLFAQMQAAFDYERGVLQVTDMNLVQGEVVPFQWGIPLLTLDIGGKPATAHLDTGNLASKLYVTEEVAATLALAGPAVKKGTAHTVAGPQDTMEAPLAASVRFGNTVLPIEAVRWPGAFGDGQLGSKGLAGQTARIDWRSRRVSIRPEANAPVCP